jgi:hypothetical protein
MIPWNDGNACRREKFGDRDQLKRFETSMDDFPDGGLLLTASSLAACSFSLRLLP